MPIKPDKIVEAEAPWLEITNWAVESAEVTTITKAMIAIVIFRMVNLVFIVEIFYNSSIVLS